MFQIDDDMTIYITRGDVAYFSVTADNNGVPYKFKPGDVVRIKVYAKKDATNVAFQKDFPILEESEKVDILLTEAETKIGDVISKPVDYWYEIELNPYTNPQTIIGYDDDGAKIFKLFPEGKDLGPDTVPEDVPVVDAELSLTSERPVQNQAVTRALVKLSDNVMNEVSDHAETLAKVEAEMEEAINKTYVETDRVSNEIAVERARINNLAALEEGSTTGDAELIDLRVGEDGVTYASAGESVRTQFASVKSDLGELETDLNTETTNRNIAIANEQKAREEAIENEQSSRSQAITRAVNAETERAVARENEIEELFTMPTQEAVTKWLDEHPEATTTVQDKSLTTEKFDEKTLAYLKGNKISMRAYGFVDNTDGNYLMSALIEELRKRNETEVIVDVYGVTLGTVDLTGVFNVTFSGVYTHVGKQGEPTPNIIVDEIILNQSYSVNFRGVCIKGNSDMSVIHFTGVTRNNVISECMIYDGNIGIDVGLTEDGTDNANVIIKDCVLYRNNYGMSFNSGNGRIYCSGNFVYSKINNVLVYGGVNTFTGNTHESDYAEFLGDFHVYGGGITLNGHDCDADKGYLLHAEGANLPIVLSNARHYDSGMTLENTPYSIYVDGCMTTISIVGGYFYNDVILDIGSNYKATVIGAHLLNGKIKGTARITCINSYGADDGYGVGGIRTSEPIYPFYNRTNHSDFGLLEEYKNNLGYSTLNKNQNGLILVNNGYIDTQGNYHRVEDGFPFTRWEVAGHISFDQFNNNDWERIMQISKAGIPYMTMGAITMFFGDRIYAQEMVAGDICFEKFADGSHIYTYNGSEWVQLV